MHEWESVGAELAPKMVSTRDPRVFPWGFYAYDPNSAYGKGRFYWFTCIQELLDFITLHAPEPDDGDDCCCGEPHDGSEACHRLKSIIEIVNTKENVLSPELKANITVATGWPIPWWGTFAELCAGKDDFCKSIVRVYLAESGASINRPEIIDLDQIPGFAGMIMRFGLE